MATRYLVLAFAAFIVQASAQCCNRGEGQLVSTQQFVSTPQQIVTSSPCGCKSSPQLVSSPVQEQYVVISPQQVVSNSPRGCQASQQYISNAPQIVSSSPCGCQSQQYSANAPKIVASSPCGCQSQQYVANAPQVVASSPCGCQSQQYIANTPQIVAGSPCGCQSQQYVANAPKIVTSSPCGCQSQQLVANQASASPLYATPVVATTLIDNSVSNSLANALQLLIVSDLIESTLNARECSTNQIVPVYDGSIVETYTDYVPACQQSFNAPVEIDYVESYGPVEYFSNNYQEVITPVAQLSPSVAEVVFPTSIPAQLVCQLSYVPTAVPVVNVDVQPLSSGYGSSGCGCAGSSGSICGCGGSTCYY